MWYSHVILIRHTHTHTHIHTHTHTYIYIYIYIYTWQPVDWVIQADRTSVDKNDTENLLKKLN